MTFLERYRAGDYEQVWSELQALGPAVRQEPVYHLAYEVAVETMRRVRQNCQRIVSRLHALDYTFGVYPDGSRDYYTLGPLVPPDRESLADCARLEAQAGTLPLSLAAFWRVVGSVDLVGMHPAWPRLLDPLVVSPPASALSDLDLTDEEGNPRVQFEGGLAPDDLHKDNISGGAPYSVALPDPNADFILRNERHGLLFVPYLRLAILRWGGFPGLERSPTAIGALASLALDLDPF